MGELIWSKSVLKDVTSNLGGDNNGRYSHCNFTSLQGEDFKWFACFFYQNGPFPGTFSLFRPLGTVNSKYIQYKFCQRLDSNRGRLVSEANAMPTEPQPLPNNNLLLSLRSIFSKITTMTKNPFACVCET